MIERSRTSLPLQYDALRSIGRFIDFNSLGDPLFRGRWFAFENFPVGLRLLSRDKSVLKGLGKFHWSREGSLDNIYDVCLDRDDHIAEFAQGLEFGVNIIWTDGGGAILNGFSDWLLASDITTLHSLLFDAPIQEEFFDSESVFNGQESYLDPDAAEILRNVKATWHS